MNAELAAGHYFRANGDLVVATHADQWLLFRILGIRQGEKVVLEQWAERRCPSCGCPQVRYHSIRCRIEKEMP